MREVVRSSSDDNSEWETYRRSSSVAPLFLQGDCLAVLAGFPGKSVACCITSPPYWGHRAYHGKGIGQEATHREYVGNLATICEEIRRVLADSGSFWLVIGDSYSGKRQVGIPWRVALELTDSQGWILRNDVVWNKVKGGPDNAADKLRNVHEYVFHLVLSRDYYYNVDAIRSNPRKAQVRGGAIISATGVSGVRYRRQIELSTELTPAEKREALAALEEMLGRIVAGELADFRMIIRGQQRATHSDAESVSGRARELREKGYYFLRYHPRGSKPGDVWDILPEDTQGRKLHFAPFPEDLCKIPILATCPEGGVVLDPFCGTGTTNLVAHRLGRKSVGIDVSPEYLGIARDRCSSSPGARAR